MISFNLENNDRYHYNKDKDNKDILTDESGQKQVMMEWEKLYMEAVIGKLKPSGDVLEIGFGLGYSANAIQKFDINSHTIIEADKNVLKRLEEWAPLQKHKVNIIEGCWQYRLPSMIQKFDSFFFDDFDHPDYPSSSRYQNFLYFYQQIVQKNVKKRAKLAWFFSDDFLVFPCSVFMRWDMYEFITDIPESITDHGYEKPKQMLSRQKIYIPIITFNTDSSEMGGYAFKIK